MFHARTFRHRLLRTLLCLTLVAAGGSFLPGGPARAAENNAASNTPLDLAAAHAFLIHINGIGGRRMIDRLLIDGLERGGFTAEHVFFDWTGGQTGLLALQGYEKHKTQARKLADLILDRYQQDPKTTFFITAHSGGAGIAAFALELLPDDVLIDSVVFFAPALSPQYDLSKALRHVRKNLYVFSSPLDAVVLSTGTKLFGTIDGVRSEAAGLNGFVQPASADAEQYKKLVPYPYRRSWLMQYGNAGSHICAMRPKFARDYVAPLLLGTPVPDDADNAPTENADEKLSVGPTTRPSREPVTP